MRNVMLGDTVVVETFKKHPQGIVFDISEIDNTTWISVQFIGLNKTTRGHYSGGDFLHTRIVLFEKYEKFE